MKQGEYKKVYGVDESRRAWQPGRPCKVCGNMEIPYQGNDVEPSSPPDDWLAVKIWSKGAPCKVGLFCSFMCLAAFMGDIRGLAQTPEIARERAIKRGTIFPPQSPAEAEPLPSPPVPA